MVPPTGPLNLDVEAISGICGSISIACWVVVFSPQIFENFRRGSADGLSLQFIIVWLAGDVFNILGAVLQHVLPTMIILAVYYTIADIVLLGQCFYYRGFTWRDEVVPPPPQQQQQPKKKKNTRRSAAPAGTDSSTAAAADERTALLHHHERRPSWSALSPAVPFAPEAAASAIPHPHDSTAAAGTRSSSTSALQAALFNTLAMLMVCLAGIAGWYLSGGSKKQDKSADGGDDIVFSYWGQVFGYMCAVLYLGSRLPQLLLNWRRQSTDGVSMLFFLFACLGNLTYVLSIVAYDGCSASADPDACTADEARRQYGRYLLVNLSWLAGSLGTLLLDMGIFIQFFLYRVEGGDEEAYADNSDDDETIANAAANDDSDEDDRPLLRRNLSSYHS